MKKGFVLFLALILSVSATAFAGGQAAANQPADGNPENLKPLSYCLLNAYENDGHRAEPPEGLDELIEYKIFESYSDAVLAISTGVGDVTLGPARAADYIAARNAALESEAVPGQINYFMGAALGNEALRDKLDQGLAMIKESGELDALIEKWLNNNDFDRDMESIALPQFEGAETIRVAITGDMPPLDYADAAGTPAGFNVAMLAALSNALRINIQMVTISTGARLTALVAGKVDALFYCVRFDENKTDDRLLLTDCYYTDTTKRLFRKGEAEYIDEMLKRVNEFMSKARAAAN